MVDGFYVNTYEDVTRDSVFENSLDSRLLNSKTGKIDDELLLNSF